MQSTSPWHTPSAKRDKNNYRAGWNAYVAGSPYNFHGNQWWQKGFRDARDEASGIDRNRVRDGGVGGRDRD